MRRLALSAGALVVAASFSSCSSVGKGSTAAEVNGHRLSIDELATLSEDSADATVVRKTLSTWIEVVAVTDDPSGLTSADELADRKKTLLTDLLGQFGDAGRATYELGIDGSPLLCLRAIPLDGTVTAATVLADLEAGTAFADAATAYSVDETLASTGGLVKSPEGFECIGSDQFNPALIAALDEASAVVGEPAAVSLSENEVVILLRPYDELTLSEAERLRLSANELGGALRESYDAAEISVSSRIGQWHAEDGRVVATGTAVNPSPAATLPAPTG